MNEGLFGSLKNGNSRLKNSYNQMQSSNQNMEQQLEFNGWDGTTLPLPTNNSNSYIEEQTSYGLPQTKTKAPWDVEEQPIMEQNVQNNINRNENYFPQQVSYQEQMNDTWQGNAMVNVPQNNNNSPYQSNENYYEENIPASMYSYSESPQMARSQMLDNYGQIASNPYAQQQINTMQSQMQQNYSNYSNVNNGLQSSRLDELLNQTKQQDIQSSGLNPFGEHSPGYGATGIEIENPHDHSIIDRTANLKYIQAGHNNISAGSSQYGLCDVTTKEWIKQNIILAIPFVNLFYVLYVGYMQNFIKYPTLKEWARGAIINTIMVNIAWLMAIYSLILLSS